MTAADVEAAAGGSTRPRPRARPRPRLRGAAPALLHAHAGGRREVQPDDLAVPRDARRDRLRARVGGRGGDLLPLDRPPRAARLPAEGRQPAHRALLDARPGGRVRPRGRAARQAQPAPDRAPAAVRRGRDRRRGEEPLRRVDDRGPALGPERAGARPPGEGLPARGLHVARRRPRARSTTPTRRTRTSPASPRRARTSSARSSRWPSGPASSARRWHERCDRHGRRRRAAALARGRRRLDRRRLPGRGDPVLDPADPAPVPARARPRLRPRGDRGRRRAPVRDRGGRACGRRDRDEREPQPHGAHRLLVRARGAGAGSRHPRVAAPEPLRPRRARPAAAGADDDPDNHASQRVAEKAGYRREAVLRSHLDHPDGRRRDSVMFSLLPGELAT